MRKYGVFFIPFVFTVMLILGLVVLSGAVLNASVCADADEAALAYAYSETESGYVVAGIDPVWAEGLNEAASSDIVIRIPAEYDGGEGRLPVVSVGEGAFRRSNCRVGDRYLSLVSADFSKASNLIKIEAFAFFQSKLKTLDLTECKSLRLIGSSAFGASPLEEVRLNGLTALEDIGEHAFKDCTALKSLAAVGLTGLRAIGAAAFYRTALEYADFSGAESLTEVSAQAFGRCASFRALILRGIGMIDGIDEGAFEESGSFEYMLVEDEGVYLDYRNSAKHSGLKDFAVYEIGIFFVSNNEGVNPPPEVKLYGMPFCYAKDQATGVWFRDGDYRLPDAGQRPRSFYDWMPVSGGMGGDGGAIIPINEDSPVTPTGEPRYEAVWTEIDGIAGVWLDAAGNEVDAPDRDYYSEMPLDGLHADLVIVGTHKGLTTNGPTYYGKQYTLKSAEGGDRLAAGINTVTAEYAGLTCTFRVDAIPLKLLSLVVEELKPAEYVAFDSFDRNSVRVSGKYNDGSVRELSDYNLSYENGRECFLAGDGSVRISYSGAGGEAEALLKVKDVAKAQFDMSAVEFPDRVLTYSRRAMLPHIANLPEGLNVFYTVMLPEGVAVSEIREEGVYLVTAKFVPEDADNYLPIQSLRAVYTVQRNSAAAWVYILSIGLPLLVLGGGGAAAYIIIRKRRSAVVPAETVGAVPDMGMTEREKDVAELLIQGKSRKEISETLFISENTVKTHISNILEKTGCKSKMEFALKYKDKGGDKIKQ